MYKITMAYDENAPHWSKEITDEREAWETYFSFLDWGFADEYATLNLYNPAGKCYTTIFYRENRKVVKK
jgi:hypothetical protein